MENAEDGVVEELLEWFSEWSVLHAIGRIHLHLIKYEMWLMETIQLITKLQPFFSLIMTS